MRGRRCAWEYRRRGRGWPRGHLFADCGHELVLRRRPHIPGQQTPEAIAVDGEHDAVAVGVVPLLVGVEDPHGTSVDGPLIPALDDEPVHSPLVHSIGEVQPGPGVRCLPVLPQLVDVHGQDHVVQPAAMVSVRVGDHEDVEVPEVELLHVREDDGLAHGLGATIHEHRGPAREAHKDRVPLPHVQEHELHVVGGDVGDVEGGLLAGLVQFGPELLMVDLRAVRDVLKVRDALEVRDLPLTGRIAA